MTTLSEERIATDVLVVGAGASGMTAAITAADCGANVTICEKGNARRSGGIPGGNDHFACIIPGIHSPSVKESLLKRSTDNVAVMADEILLNQQLDLSYEVLQKWESWGANMKTNGHYEFTGHSWPGSTGKTGEPGKTDRTWLHFSDNMLCTKLERQAKKRDVRIMNRVMVTELLKDSSGRVVGAIGISTREPKIYTIQAKSVIINKGDISAYRIYPSPHLIAYSMAEPGTGEGTVMAYKAGADIENAEFCFRQAALRFGPWAGKGTWIGVLRDAEGRPIAPPYLSEPNAETGDMAVENTDAIENAWATGRGPVWMDPRGISDEDERYMRWGFESEALSGLLGWFDREKIDIKKTRFEFVVLQPRIPIHIRTDVNYRTSVKGLYAIITLLALSGGAVSGMVAGQTAANDARDAMPADMEGYHDRILKAKQQYEEILNRGGQQFADWREAQWAIWQIMNGYALPSHRTENTLVAGYNQLLRLRERASRILKASNQHDLYHCLEVLNLMDIAELIILAIKERKESRGQARRQDYPFINPLLNKFLVITQKDGRPTFRWEVPRRVSSR